MAKQTKRPSNIEAQIAVLAPQWTGGRCLALIHEFNARFVDQLVSAARDQAEPSASDVVRVHRSLWMELDAPARALASRCPFLLADIRFQDVKWWQRAQCASPSTQKSGYPRRMFARKPAIELTRDALIVAWYIAREDICLAVLMLGMSAAVADIVGRYGLHHLWYVADHHHQHLRPRCEHRVSFWGRLLSASVRGDCDALHDLHRHAFQIADAESRPPVFCQAPVTANRRK